MTLTDPAVDPADFPRDQWGRPLIVPPSGGKPVPYIRASSAAKTIEDTFNLELWARRNVAFGMAHDASLTARVLAVGGDPSTWDLPTKKAVNRIVKDATTVAQAHKGADIGTAVHRLTERLDRGEHVVAGPYEADLEAYVNALATAGLTVTDVECRIVCDALEMAGTADRIVRDLDGRHRILDLKTGATVDYGALGWAAQLAAYAHGQLYDPELAVRLETPALDRSVGYICHLPAGQGVCTLYEIDLVAGHRAAVLANEIRSVRRESKRWITALTTSAPVAEAATRHPSAGPDRRDALRARYRALPVEAQVTFRERGVDPDDLDAVEVAIDELEPGAVVAVPAAAAAPTTQDLHAALGRGGDEGGVYLDGWDELAEAHGQLDPRLQWWFGALVLEANRAGVPFHAHAQRTKRRFHLYRGLLAVAATFDNPDDLDDVVRGLAAHVIGDAALHPTVTVGHVVGSMDAHDAGVFAGYCALYVDGRMAADYSAGPTLRLVPT